MTASDLQPFGEWEWRTETERLLLPSSHAGHECSRVRYRRRGDRVYRSFLLLEPPDDGFTPEAIVAAIEEHAAR